MLGFAKLALAAHLALITSIAPAGFWIGPSGYYEGDQQSPTDQAVPQRPDPTYTFSNGAWSQNATLGAEATYKALLLAGVQITSSGNSALSGTYAIGSYQQRKLLGIASYINFNNAFPDGLSSYPWPDVTNQLHNFPTPASFLAFADAYLDYCAKLDRALDTAEAGQTPAWPANNQLTIP